MSAIASVNNLRTAEHLLREIGDDAGAQAAMRGARVHLLGHDRKPTVTAASIADPVRYLIEKLKRHSDTTAVYKVHMLLYVAQLYAVELTGQPLLNEDITSPPEEVRIPAFRALGIGEFLVEHVPAPSGTPLPADARRICDLALANHAAQSGRMINKWLSGK